MFQDTRPAELDTSGAADPWAEFRVGHPQERLRLLRQLRDTTAPVMLNTPQGHTLSTTLWAVDTERQSLSLDAGGGIAPLERVVDADEAVAVAYLESVKLQFDLHGFVVVHGARSSALCCDFPREMYRFQRRGAYRVRPATRQAPVARLRHPGLPEMALALRVIDISIGGCALWLPADVPTLQPGTLIGEMRIELDDDTRFSATVRLQHASALGQQDGLRLGCEWQPLDGTEARTLQRWIDRTQQRRRLLTLE